MASSAPRDRFDMGRVVQHAAGAIQRNLATFSVLAVALAGAPAVVSTIGLTRMLGRLASMGGGAAPDLTAVASGGLITLAGGLFGVVTNAVLQAAVIYGAAAYLNGRPCDLGDCLGAGIRRCLPLIGLTLLMIPALAFGAMLFVVPAVMMGVAWIAAVPALVVERTGVFGAFTRSANLTRGRRWPIFGLVFVYFVAITIVQQVIDNLVGAAFVAASPQVALLNRLPVNAALGVVMSVVTATGIAAIYYELRVTREGVGPEALAAVFD